MTGGGGGRTLSRHLMGRVLVPALAILLAVGAAFMRREEKMLEAQLAERLEAAAGQTLHSVMHRLEGIQEQVRAIAANDLARAALAGGAEGADDCLGHYFGSMGGVAGTGAEARFSLLDAEGDEVATNGKPGGPTGRELEAGAMRAEENPWVWVAEAT